MSKKQKFLATSKNILYDNDKDKERRRREK